MKAEGDAEEEGYKAFMRATPRCRRKRSAFQTGSNSSTIAFGNYDSNLEKLDSFDSFNSRDDEGEEDDEVEDEEKDCMALDYP